MSPRPRKAEDADVFAAIGADHEAGRTHGSDAARDCRGVRRDGGSPGAAVWVQARAAACARALRRGNRRRGRRGTDPDTFSSPLDALQAMTTVYAQLATSPRAAVRNLAYLQNDLADPALRRHLLRLSLAARAHYRQLVTEAVAAGALRADTDIPTLARLIEVTLRGSLLAWMLYREGTAADYLREDLDATLRPYIRRNREKESMT